MSYIRKSNYKSKYKIMSALVIGIEIIICLLICLTDNIHKYDFWSEDQATISDISIDNSPKPPKSSRGTDCFIIVDYNGDKILMHFSGYSPELNKDDIITIKCNPDNKSEIVYLPYEKHRILFKRIKASVLFLVLIIVSLFIILNIKEKDPYYT